MCLNKLILGDNLEILKNLSSDSIDLIYLDPPFFSNRTYEMIWGDEGEKRSFEDRFAGGIDYYISWLKIRVRQMYRILKPTGSMFLHCDWHASHYIKCQILYDPLLFGRNNSMNEIVWAYKRPSAPNQKQFKADIVMDKTVVQKKKFTESEHNIAVQAVDKKGLSGTDKLKIKVKNKSKK